MQLSTILVAIVPLLPTFALAAPTTSSLEARADAYNFQVFPTGDCSGGSFVFFGSAIPTKNNFGQTQFSARINTINSNLHVTFYERQNQAGATSRYTNSATGQCVPINALSFGVFSN